MERSDRSVYRSGEADAGRRAFWFLQTGFVLALLACCLPAFAGLSTGTGDLATSARQDTGNASLSSLYTHFTTTHTEIIDTAHDHIHHGRYFSGGAYNAAVANNATLDLLVRTGTLIAHSKFTATGNGDATIQLYEGTTFSAAGAAVTLTNHNRNSLLVPGITITSGPTVTAVGTQLNGTVFLAGGSLGAGASGSGLNDIGFGNEFDLAPNTTYLFRVTNVSGSPATLAVSYICYIPGL